MPDISAQLQMIENQRNRTQNNWDNVSKTLGDVLGRREAVDAQQAVVKFFTENDATPESIRDINARYPNVPLPDIYTIASAVGKQREAKTVLDQASTIQSLMQQAVDSGKEFDFSQLPRLIPNLHPATLQRLKEYKELYPEAKLVEQKPGHAYQRSIGGKLTGDITMGPDEDAEIWLEKDGVKRFETKKEAKKLVNEEGWNKLTETDKSALGGAIADLMTTINKNTGKSYTASEAYKFLMKTPDTKYIKIYSGSGRNVREDTIPEGTPIPQGWGTSRPLFAPAEPDKPEYSIKQALDKQSQIAATLTRLGKGSAIDALVATLDPSMASLIGSTDPEALSAAKESLRTQLKHVQQFIPQNLRVPQGRAEPGNSGQDFRDHYSMALQAIKAGKDPIAVRNLFRKNTGRELNF